MWRSAALRAISFHGCGAVVYPQMQSTCHMTSFCGFPVAFPVDVTFVGLSGFMFFRGIFPGNHSCHPRHI
jgi:hypothetical protein